MSKLQMLNVFLTERLTAAAVEIFGAVEQAIEDYQEEHIRFKQENDRLRRLLDYLILDEIKMQGTESDRLRQLSLQVSEEEGSPEQHCEQERSSSLEQDDPEPTWSLSLEQDDPEPTWSPSLGQEEPEPTRIPSLGQKESEPTRSSSLEKEELEPTRRPSPGQENTEPTRRPQPTWSLSVKQEYPQPTQIKEEEQELRACGGGELKCDTTESLFTITCVRSLCNQENPPQPSDLNLAQTVESSVGDSPQHTYIAGVETELESESDRMDYTISEPTSDSQPLSRVNVDSSISGKPYKSKPFSKSFNRKYKSSDLKIVGLHRRGGSYACKECGQTFRHQWQLARMPYPHQCSQTLVSRYTLRDRKRLYTGERSYACKKCGQSFLCHLELAKHLSHTRCWAVLSYN